MDSGTQDKSTLTDDTAAEQAQASLAQKLAEAEKSKSLLALFVEQFAEHKVAVVSLALLAVISLLAILAPVVVNLFGVNPTDQNILHRFAEMGAQVSLPQSTQEERIELWSEENPELLSDLVRAAHAAELVSVDEADEEVPFLLNELRQTDPAVYEQFMTQKLPAQESFADMTKRFDTYHLLGTDELGRDVFARLIYGARISLMVAALVGICSAVLGLLFGATAGYFGGVLDNVLMRITDALLTIPTLPLYIIFAAADLSKLPLLGAILEGENQSVVKMVVIMFSLTWMPIARIVRGTVLSIKESEYVLAARTIGLSNFSIIVGHVIPNVFGPLVVAVTLLMGDAMLIETGLSFLGLGIQPPIPSWGNMLQNALELVRTMPILAIIPGLMIFVVIIAINFVGDGLRDALDPKAIRR
jgi:peptide/nickel transport system permease protein